MKELGCYHIPPRDEVVVTALICDDGNRYIDISQTAWDDPDAKPIRVASWDIDDLIDIIDRARKVLLNSYREPPDASDSASPPTPVPPEAKAQ